MQQQAHTVAREGMAKRVSVDRWIFGVTLVLVFIGPGDDLQRLGGDGQREIRLRILLPFASNSICRCRTSGDVRHDERRLQEIEASGDSFLAGGPHDAIARRCIFPRHLAQHPSLVALRRSSHATIGAGEAGVDPLPGIFS